MPDRHLPVRPNLDQLKHQAKDLLKAIRSGDSSAIADLEKYHPEKIEADSAKLADAQLVLARSYGVPSWSRLVQACHLIDAIWRDDPADVRRMVLKHPQLIKEMARGTEQCNWGPPMSYAANLGRDQIIRMLHNFGATDHAHALGRATLQSKIETARMIHTMMGIPRLPDNSLGGSAYTLSASGTALMLELGAQVRAEGKRLAPVDVVLETDSRNPSAKHQILELYVQYGLELPDSPIMALHRGRIDLLEQHLRRDPDLLRRTFSFEEIYPPELGCHNDPLATFGTPLAGTTLLHMCIDYDEMEIALWLIDCGVDDNKPQGAPLTQLLLDHGADPNARASLRKELHPGYEIPGVYEYRDVTPLSWGERFHFKKLVSRPAMELIIQRGGKL